MNTTKIKIQDLISRLDFIDTASVIHCASEALRHDCGFSRAFADLGLKISALTHEAEDSDWISDDIADIRDTNELVNLIVQASFRLQLLNKQQKL